MDSQLNSVRLAIFDLDGTLIDSEEDLVIAVNATRRELGLGPLEMASVAKMVGRGAAELVRQAVGDVDEQVYRRSLEFFVHYYRRHAIEHTRLYPGVQDTVEELHVRGYQLAVLTNKPTRISRDILDALRLAHRMRFIYGGRGPLPGPPLPANVRSFERKKPDPEGLLALLAATGVEPRQAVMIGDSAVDVQTGRNAGTWTCGVLYGFQPESFAECPPDFEIGSFPDLLRLLPGPSANGRT